MIVVVSFCFEGPGNLKAWMLWLYSCIITYHCAFLADSNHGMESSYFEVVVLCNLSFIISLLLVLHCMFLSIKVHLLACMSTCSVWLNRYVVEEHSHLAPNPKPKKLTKSSNFSKYLTVFQKFLTTHSISNTET